jgi:2-phosphoglycerate kinase
MFEKAGYTGNQSAQQVGQDNHESNKLNKARDMTVQLNYELIEKTIKTYKSHRNARDFDVAFIKSLKLDKTKEKFIKEVITKMKSSF